MCRSVFSRHFWVKNGVQGQKNVQNGSKQSGDVPRVFVKCVGVGVGVGRGRGACKTAIEAWVAFFNFFS